MNVTELVTKKFVLLNRLEVGLEGMSLERIIKKDVDIQKKALHQLLIMCANLICEKYKIENDVGPEIFDMYDCKIVIEKKKDTIIFGGKE